MPTAGSTSPTPSSLTARANRPASTTKPRSPPRPTTPTPTRAWPTCYRTSARPRRPNTTASGATPIEPSPPCPGVVRGSPAAIPACWSRTPAAPLSGRFLLDETVFATSVLVAEAHTPETALPPHDLVFNAVGDSDLCGPALAAADGVHGAPPRRRSIRRPGSTPPAAPTSPSAFPACRGCGPRASNEPARRGHRAAERFGYPLLLHGFGYHTGRHFHRIGTKR